MRAATILNPLLLFAVTLGTTAANVDPSCLGNENAFAAEQIAIPEIDGVNGAILDSGEGQLKEQRATNPLYEVSPSGPRARSRFGKLARLVFSRPAKEVVALNRAMTEEMGRAGMDFLVKDSNGSYSKRHKVPIHSPVVPIDADYYHALNQTTQPYLVASRRFLQAYFSLGPKGSRSEYLREMGLPANAWPQVKQLIELVEQSIYKLPGLQGRRMKDYPFHSGPIGFDAVLRNLEIAEGIFFEPNKGTPSGITNITKQLEILRKTDPEMWKLVREAMIKNDTFRQFRASIESAGKAWTGVDGIAVVVGPGEYNGAHPDVASIAMFTGMPLVKPGDMYMGKDGYIYLKTGAGEGTGDPRVTAIYSRMEESFILQEGFDLNQGASPMIQTFVDNAALGKQLGLTLKDGVYYQYVHEGNDITKPVVDVARDAQGQPLMAVSYNRALGPSPSGETSGSLRDAITSGKIFLNNLGARMVDNKRGFSIIHELGKFYAGEGQTVAGPPPSLTRSEWRDKFLKDYDSDQWVVKVDDSSGGDGIYIFANMGSQERARISRLVNDSLEGRAGAKDYEIQIFTTSAAQTTAEEGANGAYFTNRVIDLRIFPFFFADGHVESGPTGLLGRTAPRHSAKANTSAGGGYATVAVLAKRALNLPESDILPGPVRQQYVGSGSREDLVRFFQDLHDVSQAIKSGPGGVNREMLKNFAISSKRVMHLIDWEWQGFRSISEEYAQGERSFASLEKEFGDQYRNLLAKVRAGEDVFLAEGMLTVAQAAQARVD